jgi:hypothetical protein
VALTKARDASEMAKIKLYYSLGSGEWAPVFRRSLQKAQRKLQIKLYEVIEDGLVHVSDASYELRAAVGQLVQDYLRESGWLGPEQYVLVELESEEKETE